MSTLRNVLENVFEDTDKKISQKALSQLKERSQSLEIVLRNEYASFFDYMADAIRISVPNTDRGLPSSLKAPGSGAFSWKLLSPSWTDDKIRWDKGISGDTSVYNMYHGLTRTMMRGVKRQRGKGLKVKPRIKQPFDEFIQGLADKTDIKKIEKIFGPLKTTYELIRPDGGKVEMKVNKAGVQSIVQYLPRKPKGKKIETTSLVGTRLRFTIKAFTTLKAVTTEEAIVDQVSRQINSPQWVKILNSYWHIRGRRPLFAPLINWYLRKLFADRTKRLFNDLK